MTEPNLTAITLFCAVFYLISKLKTRLTLSKAKYRSLSGHAKWSRIIAKQIPYFDYPISDFFRIDNAPEKIETKRREAFHKLAKAISFYDENFDDNSQQTSLSSISDINFTNAYRVPYPFRRLVQSKFKLNNYVLETKGVKIKDKQGDWYFDLSGSYGVNLFGYDFYKKCLSNGLQKMNAIGPILGLYHPLIESNVKKLKAISNLDEVSFHMSGTEAVMQAVRLARYHTGRSHLVRFCGAYHGWWDGVQPGIGNQRKTNDVYTLAELSEKTLKVLKTRKDIACILINPLQAFHPNLDAPSDASLINSSRSTNFNREEYTQWLSSLREICTQRGIVMIMDEIFTGFRLGYKGAQEFFKVQADMVTYGKTLGGGMPVGVVCGKKELMKRFKDSQPVNVSFARGTFNSHPLLMTSMNEFLLAIETPKIQKQYETSESDWVERVNRLNQSLEQANVPVKIKHIFSILTVNFTVPSAYNWMFQFYLRQEKLMLSWIGSGRFIMSHNYDDKLFQEVIIRIVDAAVKMKDDGWWHQSNNVTNKSISKNMLRMIVLNRFPWTKKIIKPNLSLRPKEVKNSHDQSQ